MVRYRSIYDGTRDVRYVRCFMRSSQNHSDHIIEKKNQNKKKNINFVTLDPNISLSVFMHWVTNEFFFPHPRATA